MGWINNSMKMKLKVKLVTQKHYELDRKQFPTSNVMNTNKVPANSWKAQLFFETLLGYFKLCLSTENQFQKYGNSFISQTWPSFSTQYLEDVKKLNLEFTLKHKI